MPNVTVSDWARNETRMREEFVAFALAHVVSPQLVVSAQGWAEIYRSWRLCKACGCSEVELVKDFCSLVGAWSKR